MMKQLRHPNGPLRYKVAGLIYVLILRYEKHFLDATRKFFGRPKPKETRAMRQGKSRKMPRKSTGLTDRLTLPMRPELLREIDQVRGDVPRVAWIRRELALAVARHRPKPRKRYGKSK